MRARFSPTILAAAMLTPAFASAQSGDSGFYGTFEVGPSIVEDMNFAEATTANLNIDPKAGIAVRGGLGYRLTEPLRIELSLGYSHNNLNGGFQQNVQVIIPCGTIPGQPCLNPNVDGNIDGFSGFLNGYYDFPAIGALKPYAGIGVGFVSADFDVGADGLMNDGTRSRFAILDESDTVVGYRGTLGAAYPVGPVDLTLAYTYTFTDRVNVAGRGTYVNFNFDKRVNTHTINVGAVYRF